MARLGDCFLIIRNGASIKQTDGANGIPITRIETISNRKVDRNKLGYAGIYDSEKYNEYILQNDDVLMSHINSEKHLGKVAIYQRQENEKIIHGMNLLMLRANQNIVLPKYSVYYFETPLFLQQIVRITKKSVNQASFTVSALKELQIPLPPLDEQRKIAAVLDKVSDLIAKRRQQLDKLDLLVKSKFIEMFGDVITNNMNWSIYPLSKITTSRLGKMLDTKKQTGKSTFPYLANFNVQWFQFDTLNLNTMDFSSEEQEEFNLLDGDLLICEGGEVGRCAVWHNQVNPCYFQKALHRVRCNRDIIEPDYLSWWIKFHYDYNQFKDIVGSKATIAHLTGVKLKSLSIVVPDIKVQRRFKQFIEQTEKTKSTIQQSLEKLETLKKALMQEYFG